MVRRFSPSYSCLAWVVSPCLTSTKRFQASYFNVSPLARLEGFGPVRCAATMVSGSITYRRGHRGRGGFSRSGIDVRHPSFGQNVAPVSSSLWIERSPSPRPPTALWPLCSLVRQVKLDTTCKLKGICHVTCLFDM
jgi:hypothetical protein